MLQVKQEYLNKLVVIKNKGSQKRVVLSNQLNQSLKIEMINNGYGRFFESPEKFIKKERVIKPQKASITIVKKGKKGDELEAAFRKSGAIESQARTLAISVLQKMSIADLKTTFKYKADLEILAERLNKTLPESEINTSLKKDELYIEIETALKSI